MQLSLSPRQLRLLRMRAQHLVFSGSQGRVSPLEILEQVVAVQAQDLPAGRLSLRARGCGLTSAEVERLRQEARSIVWTWCLRGTLHLVRAEDARWLIDLLGPDFVAADRRRFEQLGWDEPLAGRATRLLHDTIAGGGGLTRPEVIQLLGMNGFPHEGQAPIHLIARLVLEGTLCIGPDRGGQPTYVLFDDWLGRSEPVPRPQALLRLAHRYLAAYGPATPRDLASWSGLKLGELRRAWEQVADRLIQVEVSGQAYWMLESQLPWLADGIETDPVVRLLPFFDTYLLGYASRDLAVDPAHARRINPGGGIIRPVLLVDGVAMGTWRIERRRAHLEVQVERFESIPGDLIPLVEAEVADLGRFLEAEAILNVV